MQQFEFGAFQEIRPHVPDNPADNHGPSDRLVVPAGSEA
jgi:hypothetical protein